jgi:hypothetical protein
LTRPWPDRPALDTALRPEVAARETLTIIREIVGKSVSGSRRHRTLRVCSRTNLSQQSPGLTGRQRSKCDLGQLGMRFHRRALVAVILDRPAGTSPAISKVPPAAALHQPSTRSTPPADGRQVRLYSRSGYEWTKRLPALAETLRALPCHSAGVRMRHQRLIPDFKRITPTSVVTNTGNYRNSRLRFGQLAVETLTLGVDGT